MNYPLEYDAAIHENDANKDIKSVFARMAGMALELFEETREDACVFKIFDGPQTAMWMSNQIRKKPPIQWPPGVWEVVGRRNQVFKDGRFVYVAGSRLAITCKGDLPNEYAYVFQHPVMGRPKRDPSAAIGQRVTWTFKAFVDETAPVWFPEHAVCPVCGAHALEESISGEVQTIWCKRNQCDPLLIKAKLPTFRTPEGQRVLRTNP